MLYVLLLLMLYVLLVLMQLPRLLKVILAICLLLPMSLYQRPSCIISSLITSSFSHLRRSRYDACHSARLYKLIRERTMLQQGSTAEDNGRVEIGSLRIVKTTVRA
jgi:hypothetical protein